MRATAACLVLLAGLCVLNAAPAAARSLNADATPQLLGDLPILGPILGPILDPVVGPILSPVLDPIVGPVLGPVLGPILGPMLNGTGISVTVNVTVDGAPCRLIKNRVRGAINTWLKRLLVLVKVNVNSTKCTAGTTSATVTVKVNVPLPSNLLGIDLTSLLNTVKGLVGNFVNVDDLVKQSIEIAGLVNALGLKGFKISNISVTVA